jgi:hypothetical protein
MRQAVRVGRQILLPRIRSQGKTGIQSVAAVSSTSVGTVGGQRLCTFRFKRFVTLGVECLAEFVSGCCLVHGRWSSGKREFWGAPVANRSCRKRVASTALPFAVFAPVPNTSVSTQTDEKPGPPGQDSRASANLSPDLIVKQHRDPLLNAFWSAARGSRRRPRNRSRCRPGSLMPVCGSFAQSSR